MNATVALTIIGALLLLPGCQKPQTPDESAQQAEQAQPKETAGSDAKPPAPQAEPEDGGGTPIDYLQTVTRQPKAVAKKLDALAMQQSLRAFEALEGRLPATLDELKKAGFDIPAPPAGTAYQYDPKTGKVELVEAK